MVVDGSDSAGRDAKGPLKRTANAATKSLKYKKYSNEPDPLEGTKKLPSQTIAELGNPRRHTEGWRPKPSIIEHLNMADFTHQVQCQVPVDEPIFQPFPPEVLFHGYAPFKSYTASLYFRNNDIVPRRIKLIQPDTPFLSIKRTIMAGKDEGSKIAAGMEVCFTVTFRPESVDNYSHNLVVCTEREKFIIPVIAAGAAPALDIPDIVEFGVVPSRTEGHQTLLVRNVGNQASSFTLRAQPPFTVNPTQGYLSPEETLQLQLGFVPSGPHPYHGELEVKYHSSGHAAYSQLTGYGNELGVGLSQDVVTLLPTYVTKNSQRTFKVVNRSGIAVKFAIRQHQAVDVDELLRGQKLGELFQSQAIELHELGSMQKGEGAEGEESEDEDAILADAESALRRRYRPLQQAAALDTQLFGSKNFQVSPAEGVVWPGSEVEVMVQFFPDFTREYEEVAFVEIQGLERRLPISFRGKGLGPAAMFSYDILDVGLTYANTPHQYEVELQNRGKIDVEFRLLAPVTPFGKMFKFEPDHGHLTSGEIQIIRVRLRSDLLGAFSETFDWSIKGSSTPLSLQLKGYVAGPSFEIDVEALEFGVVSYGFRYTKELTLTNTSEIPMKFAWRVPEDATKDVKEFMMLPQKGSILPGGKQKISVEFVSQSVQRYAYNLVMDIPGITIDAHSLPIKAECVVPKLTLSTQILSFGDCFLRYPYKRSLRISNESKLPAKFEVLPQDNQSKNLAVFSIEPASGGIAAMGDLDLEITLHAQTLGRLQIPVRVKVLGSRGGPLDLVIDAKCLGPILSFGPPDNRSDTAVINFGKINVLNEVFKNLTIHNPSPIPADFKLFVEGRDSLFSVEPKTMHLEPGADGRVAVRAALDETLTFKDELHVLVEEGADMPVPLEAIGTGNVLVCEDLSGDTLDFSHQFVGRPFVKEIMVHNMGRRTMTLVMNNERVDEIKKVQPKTGKKFDIATLPPEEQPTFSLNVDHIEIKPKSCNSFFITGMAYSQGQPQEKLVCTALLGSNARNGRKAFEVVMTADIAIPLLEFSDRIMEFHHSYEKGKSIEVLKRSLTLRNISKLPLSFALKCGPPFGIDCPSMQLEVMEAATVTIQVDPDYKGDKQSVVVPQKLRVDYADNPQKDTVDLIARMDFPNLVFETMQVEFGSCLSDTSRRIPVTITNSSAVDVVYHWTWEADSLKEDVSSMMSMNVKGGGKGAQAKPNPEQLFDILPIKGALRPGEAETIIFSFFAFPGVRANATATCVVEGGPTYSVVMSGESNYIKFTVEPQTFDLGLQVYNRSNDRDLVISNNGKVPFDFNVNTSLLSRPGVVEPIPKGGVVGPMSKEVVKLKVIPGIPAKLVEALLVDIAHFDPIPISVTVEGVYPTVSLGLPRIKDRLFDSCLEQAQLEASSQNIDVNTTSLNPPLRTASPPAAVASSTAVQASGRQSASPGKRSRSPQLRSTGRRSPLASPEPRRPDNEAERLRLVKLLLDREAALRPPPVMTPPDPLLLGQLEGLDGTEGEDVEGYDQETGSPMYNQNFTAAAEPEVIQSSIAPLALSPLLPKPVVLPLTSAPSTADLTPTAKRSNRAIQPRIPNIFSSNYLVDFGYLTKGTSRNRKFNMVNPSSQAVSLKFEKSLLDAWGFKIDPEAVSKLPERGDVEVSLTLQGNKPSVIPGPLELVLPLDIKGGPPVLLTLRANVQVPDLRLSQEVLDFETVQTGKAGVITLQLHNHKQVPCEWTVKKPVEASKCKDWAFFTMVPSEGVLEPDEKRNVKVIFTPVLGREAPYSQAIPIKINLNPKTRDFVCKAQGSTPKIKFEPTGLIECGPILPKFEGQQPNQARVKMINPCNYPIEVFCLDVDKQYIADEDVLRNLEAERFGEAGFIYQVPLAPGQPMWPEMVEEFQRKKQAAEEAAAKAEAAAAVLGADGGTDNPEVVHPSGEADAAAANVEREVGDLVAIDTSAASQEPSKLILVLYGPTMSGSTTQANLLSERYNIPAITFDDLLFEGADVEAPPPIPLTQNPPTAEDAQGNIPVVSTVAGHEGEAMPEESAPPPPYFDAEISDLLYTKVLIDPDLESKPGFVPPATSVPEAELIEILVRGVKQALLARGAGPMGEPGAKPSKFEKGFILDGVSSKYGNTGMVAKVLMRALGMEAILPEPVVPLEKPKPPKKGAPPEPPPPPPLPLSWTGPHDVHFLTLDATLDLVKERLKAKKLREEEDRAAAEAAAAALAAAEAEAAAALEALNGTASEAVEGGDAAPQQHQPPAAPVAAAAAAAAPELSEEPEVSPLSPEELAAKAAEAAAAAAAAAEAALVSEAEAIIEAFSQISTLLHEQLGEPGEGNRAVQRAFDAGAGDPIRVLREACGLSFHMGQVVVVLPKLPSDDQLIPELYHMQVVHKPRTRMQRSPITNFKLMTERLPNDEELKALREAEAAAAAAAAAAAPKGKGKNAQPPPPPEPSPPTIGLYQQGRWVIPANGSVDLVVLFQSEEVGKFSDTFMFEVVGGERGNSVMASGVCSLPQIATDYRNVFYKKVKARPSTPTIAKQFVISKNMFEFGPLLMNKDPKGFLEGAHPDNTSKLRITNNGLFDLHVDFVLKSKEILESQVDDKKKKAADAKKTADKKKGANNTSVSLDGVFAYFPTSMDLKIDETQELTIYAFPTTEAMIEDVLMCKIKDNPLPVEFPISVIGAKPIVLAYLDDGSPPPPVPPPVAPGEKPPPPAPNKLLSEGVLFGRLLVDKRDTRNFIVENPGLLPFQWRLAGVEGLPKEFSVSPVSGELQARTSIKVAVDFAAYEKRDVTGKVTLEVLDKAELQGVAVSTPITLKGEAYKIERDIRFPQEGLNGVDFGLVRVTDSTSKPIVIKNTGKYQISYNFRVKGAAKDVFTVVPDTGNVDPGKEAAVQVWFNNDKSVKRELNLVGNNDIVLSIIEPLTNNKEETLPIKVSVRAVYSKYQITPQRGINFGPTTYNTTSKPKTFEIVNTGEFAFDYRLFNPASEVVTSTPGDSKATTPSSVSKRAPETKKTPPGGQLTLGQFSFDMASGRIEAGSRVEISAVFKAVGSSPYAETLGIHVSERDHADSPGGILYEMSGESCIPGIDASNIEAIFEEHVISSSLDANSGVKNEFGTRERVFNFGSIVADLATAAEIAAAEASGTLSDVGVRANLKFINPIKVPCTVNFSIKPRGQYPAGVPFPLVADPPQLIIPPHEFRYMAVVFRPRAIQQYSATFEALVQDGSEPTTKSFSCEMRGEGVLPSLTLLEPNVFDSSGRPLIKFGRLLVGRSHRLRINLKNNGVMTSSARLEVSPNDHFTVLEGPQVFAVESKKSHTFTVEFKPLSVGAFQHEVRIKVQKNPFEDYRVMMTGEGYQEDVSFDQLPNGSMDELRFPDCPVGKPHSMTFVIRNTSAARTFRFRWPASASPHLTFSPSVGHLLPGSSKDVTVTFKAIAPVKISPQDIKMNLVQIQYKDGVQPLEWDDRSTILDYSSSGVAQQSPPTARPEPEPAATDVSGTSKDMMLKVFAVADNPRFECENKPIMFRPTMMFQTRTFTFPLKNTSGARMDFKFYIATADGSKPDTSGLYTISPEGGVIEPGSTSDITVKFAPVEVDDCLRLLVCDIPNLDASVEPLAMQLGGKVLRPWCHFDLPESDYISGGRRNPEMPGPSGAVEPLDPATKVLEIESLGVRVRNVKRFMVLNPTAIGYEFFWEPVNRTPGTASPFSCLTKRGTVTGGRQFEMVFEYVPTSDSIAESFWTFKIPEQGIEVPFLLVGLVSEPRVFFDRPNINFGQILIGGARGHSIVTLINAEHLPFEFSLDRNTYDATAELVASTGQRPVVEFEPSSGVVPPNSSLELKATFTPRLEKSVNYNVVCNVKKKPTRLALNVKGEGYAIHETLNIESADGNVVALAPRQMNVIDFGQIIINERVVRAVVLVNSGSLNYDFVWDMGTNPRVVIKPESGTVPKGERLVCELAYHPHVPDRMRDYKVSCQIINGNKYSLSLNGVGHKPRLDLSFMEADFGYVNIFQQGMTPASKTLFLRNNDSLPISVEPQWTNTDEWQMEMAPGVLQPGESRQVLLTFKPSAALPYVSRLGLEVNGLYTVNVDLKGEGAEMRLEVADPSKRAVNFGGVQRLQSSTRVVQVVNRGRVPLSFSAAPSLEVLQRYNIDVLPAGEILLRPRESAEMTFFFRPQVRMRSFTEEFLVDVGGVSVPLLSLTGACLGTELRLASDSLPFGPVVLGSRAVKRLALENTGDVGTKFTWDKRALGDNFSIFPAEGFLGPRQDVKLDVTFHPTAVGADVRADRVRLSVEGGEDRVLTLTGACIGTSAQPEAVKFSCAVRATAVQNITLHNPSSNPWSLRPTLHNEFFTGPEFVEIAAGARVPYPVTFRPLSMSAADQPHEGSVFFPIPDGTGLLYRLIGRAESPVPEGKVERALTAKVGHVEVLKVSNWMHKPQRFRVIIDRKQADKSTIIDGPEFVDIPALSSKDYKLSVHCSTTNPTVATVTFKNEASGEYCFYDLKYTAGAPPPRGNLSLECPARTYTSTKVSIRNTLDSDVVMSATCTNKQIVVPAKITVPANSVAQVEVGYRPLLVAESEAVLKIDSMELGLFEWKLKLAGLSTNPERSLAFNVPLGSRETQVFRFTHWLDEKADYKCTFKTEKGCAFECLPLISSPPAGPGGVEVSVEVHFEPTAMGESIKDLLTVSSLTGGEYQCPLVGRCLAPKPQGPIECGKGSGAVPFKNVFMQDAEFQYSIDNPAFVVPKATEKIGSKKSTNINVSFKPDAAKGFTQRTGKLTVACPSQTTSPWVFYLQASEAEPGAASKK